MPSKLTTWIARENHPTADIRLGDAVTVLERDGQTEITVHRVLTIDTAALHAPGILSRAPLGPSLPSPPTASPRVLPFGSLPDRRRSTAQTG